MHPFTYERPISVKAAVAAASVDGNGRPPVQAAAQYIAGGTNMSDYMKLGVMRPERLIDISRIADDSLRSITADDRGIRFGALVSMAQAEEHPDVKRRYPVIAATLKLAASGQIRNMASLGGNMLQRTRCEYFRETAWPCNKREPGSGCSAIGGINRQHALLGTSENCIATYHGDFAQGLIALDASIDIVGPDGARTAPFAQLHVRPGEHPDVETILQPGDMIVSIHVPAGPWAARSHYLKIRDRESYAFALTSAAVALDMDGQTVREARIALGGVATVPWRAKGAEDVLRGKQIDEVSAAAAADIAFAEAKPLKHNSFKAPLGRETLIRALLETRDMKVSQ